MMLKSISLMTRLLTTSLVSQSMKMDFVPDALISIPIALPALKRMELLINATFATTRTPIEPTFQMKQFIASMKTLAQSLTVFKTFLELKFVSNVLGSTSNNLSLIFPIKMQITIT